MPGHHKFSELRARMPAKSRARARRGAQQDMSKMLLAEIRKLAGLTQEQLAAQLGVKQPSLSQLESQQDMQISTLKRIVEALGGGLEIVVTLPGRRIALSQFKDTRGRRRNSAA
jgi:transcriptional regulator with XRE-family HTH domain